MKIWLIEFPIYQYKEDVKELAKRAGLKIIDARYKADIKPELIATEVPKLTKKSAKEIEVAK